MALGGMKLCPNCGVTKPVSEFFRCSSKRDGLRSRCKQCDREHIPSPINKWKRKPTEAKLRPHEIQKFKRVRLEYKTKLPSDVMPRGWYVIIDKGFGIPATDTMVHLWLENQALRARLRQLEVR